MVTMSPVDNFDPPYRIEGSPAIHTRGIFTDCSVGHNVATHCDRGKGVPSMKKTPRKAAEERKTLIIKIRVNAGQLKILEVAADRASLDLSTWIRTVALKAAKQG